MMRRFAALANLSLATVGSAAVVLGGSVAGAASLAPAAYQNQIATVVTISVAPRAHQNSCVDVHVTVSSDAGQPTGSVNFSVDGTLLDRRTVPANGAFTESINCSGAGTATRVLHAGSGDVTVQDVAYTLSSNASALSVGNHVLHAAYVPTGNWAPSSASATIDILAASATGAGLPGGSGFPHAVDAGLAGAAHAGFEQRAAIGGIAAVVALAAVSFYRRRATR